MLPGWSRSLPVFMTKRPMAVAFLVLLASSVAHAQIWQPLGPAGGDVRSLAADPSRPGRLFLGTSDGHVFGSEDSGEHWTLLGRAGTRLDAVVTSILVDPQNGNVLFASTWTQDPAAGGGVFRSDDGGRNWRAAGLAGQAVRALVLAPSDAKTLVAGTLDGVYRSRDAGKSWERISPERHEELRNLDSLAVDPRDPQTIYAGTFHLPWKTTDGGRTWRPIHDGMIDDSDVMSLLIDRAAPGRIYASACSGIYSSENGASQWKKIQGIPYTARRTYVIAQDPARPGLVYAATSEGLWKTADAGLSWRRTTPQDWTVNTVVVAGGEPRRVIIGTERLGVLASDDDGEHFHDANAGFFHRQIVSLALDPARPGRMLAVVANAPDPVVTTEDYGKSWQPLGPGLRAGQILRVYAAPNGWWASLAHGGLLRYDAGKGIWRRAPLAAGERRAATVSTARDSRSRILPAVTRPFEPVVNDMVFRRGRWFAATESGLLESSDQGATWMPLRIGPLTTLPVQSVRVSFDEKRMWVVSLRGMVFSADGGKSWSWHDLPLQAGGAVSLEVNSANEKTLIALARNGLYISRDAGESWQQAGDGLPATPVQGFAISGNIFLASMRTGGLYLSSDSGRIWTRLSGTVADGFFPVVVAGGDTPAEYAASATDGLFFVQWLAASATPAHSGEPVN